MATEIRLPQWGMGMREGTIVQWLKKEGESVNQGEPLVEVLIDKINTEIESPASGVLRKIVAQVDDTVPVGETMAVIGTADEPIG